MASLVSNIVRRSCPVLRSSCVAQHRALPALQHQLHQFSTSTPAAIEASGSAVPVPGTEEKQTIKMSKAMKAYQERAQAHDVFMFEQTGEYEIGRRHLANIMGEDPETFTQEDIDAAIQYLLPSALFEPRARPSMKHPSEVFAKKKAAEFDVSGRPFHTLFYTGLPTYYQTLHDLGKTVQSLDQFAARIDRYSLDQKDDQKFNTGGSQWLTKEELEDVFLEKLHDKYHKFFILAMDRLVDHPYSSRANDFIMRFRKVIISAQKKEEIPKLMYTAEGVPYMTGSGRRKHNTANVTVYGRGTGKFSINGKSLLSFEKIQDREQVVFPLQFTGLLGTVDVEAQVEDIGGQSGQSGAIRLAIARALCSFVDADMREMMRLAGLLTQDPRRKERKKPGQKGARAKYTWKKR